MHTTINFRVEKELKEAFEKVAIEMDRTPSQLFRDFMRQTVANRGAGEAIEKPRSENKQLTKGSPKPKGKKSPRSVIPENWRSK